MRERADVAGELSYLRGIVEAIKQPQRVSSANAVLYIDTRATGLPITVNYTLASSAQAMTRLTYSHPTTPTPYANAQFELANVDYGVNYVVYRDPTNLSNPYITEWIVVLRNGGPATDSFSADYGVLSSAPGTLTATVI